MCENFDDEMRRVISHALQLLCAVPLLQFGEGAQPVSSGLAGAPDIAVRDDGGVQAVSADDAVTGKLNANFERSAAVVAVAVRLIALNARLLGLLLVGHTFLHCLCADTIRITSGGQSQNARLSKIILLAYVLAMCETTGMTDMNANQLIDNLGGTAKVSRMLSVEQNTVSGWRQRGIPVIQILNLVKIAKAKRVAVPEAYKRMLP